VGIINAAITAFAERGYFGVLEGGLDLIRYTEKNSFGQSEWYRGYFVRGSARLLSMTGWLSAGIVCAPGRLLVSLTEIEGDCFANREQAERHGLELAKIRVDDQLKRRA
jgi:hypothetical protein